MSFGNFMQNIKKVQWQIEDTVDAAVSKAPPDTPTPIPIAVIASPKPTYTPPLNALEAEKLLFPNYNKTKDPLNSQYVKPLPPPPPPVPTTDYTPFIIGGAIVLFFFFKK